ncbi:MAG TPA: hypothetical protein VFS10_16395, partial [Pyrinomonadaceae bacterium]|nr:hypothetical protein [Pyrinomonadaceae bacterium]
MALAGLLHTDKSPARVAEAKQDERPTLNVIAAGINSRGTGIFADTGVVRERGKTFRIELSADFPGESRLNRNLRGVVQYAFDSGDDPPDVKVVRVSGPDDPALRSIVQEIARTPHATVNIDMDLMMFGAEYWRDQTEKLARVAAVVAEERLEQTPDSSNSIFTHSAATVGLSKLIESGKGSLYEHKVAASPMTWQLSSDVLIVQAAGDLPSTPTGDEKDIQLLNSASRNRDGWLNRGNTVVRVSGRGFDVQPSAIYESLAERAQRVLTGGNVVGAVREAVNQVKAHSAAATLGVRDVRVEVSVPFSAQHEPGEPPSPQRVERFELSNVSSGQVIKVLNGDGGPSVQTPDTRRTNWDEFKDEVKKLEPPKGGGIALRAVAELPFAADEVAGAVWDDGAGRVVLNGRDGSEVWRLPRMNPD